MRAASACGSRGRGSLAALALLAASGAGVAAACAASDERTLEGGQPPPEVSGHAANGATTTGAGGFDASGGSTSTTATSGTGGACAEVSQKADNQIQPADVILAIDQSGSMDKETNWVKTQLGGFSQQITQSGIDVQVVLIAGKPGSENGFCVPAPLGSGQCPADDNLPVFKHVDQHVDSHDALQQILGRYADYKDMMRPEAVKHVIVISDDDATKISAAEFDAALKALDPMFAKYVFHAIAASKDDPGGFACFTNPDPCCGVAADEGKIYKDLVGMTQGVFGDLCAQNFQPVWDEVGAAVITDAMLACEWAIPPPPDGMELDPGLVNVAYSIGMGEVELGQVPSSSDCANVAGGWYYDDPGQPTKILVCPQTCALLQGAPTASITIKFGCATVPATPK
jgi:hypothetical protein